MKIGELCKKANVGKELVRHYLELGLIQCSEMQAGNRYYRVFAEETLTRLELIAIGKRIGLTLKEIQPLLNAYLGQGLVKSEVLKVLTEQHEKLSGIIAQAQSMQMLIEHKINVVQEKQSLIKR